MFALEIIEKPRKKRTIRMKKGSHKYLLQLFHRIRREIRELRRTQHYMIWGVEYARAAAGRKQICDARM